MTSLDNLLAISGDSIRTITSYDTNVSKNTNTNTENQYEIGYSRERKSEHTHFLCYTCNSRGAGAFKLDERHPANQKSMLDCHLGHDLRFLTSKEAIEEIWSAKYNRPMKEKEIIALLNASARDEK